MWCAVVAVGFGAWHWELVSVARWRNFEIFHQLVRYYRIVALKYLAGNKKSLLRNVQIAIKFSYLLITSVIGGGALVICYVFGNWSTCSWRKMAKNINYAVNINKCICIITNNFKTFEKFIRNKSSIFLSIQSVLLLMVIRESRTLFSLLTLINSYNIYIVCN